jgi:hypothetical protein
MNVETNKQKIERLELLTKRLASVNKIQKTELTFLSEVTQSGTTEFQKIPTYNSMNLATTEDNDDEDHHDYLEDDSDLLFVKLGSDILGTNDNDNLGKSVSLSADGTILAVGAPYHDDNDGIVKVYKYMIDEESGNYEWMKLGNDIVSEGSSDENGYSVSLSADGTIIAIGAPENSDVHDYNGHTRIFQYSDINVLNGTWTQLGIDLDGEDEANAGYSVSLSADGTIVAFGAKNHDIDEGYSNGAVYVYKYLNSSWSLHGQILYGGENSDDFGEKVAISKNGQYLACSSISHNDDTGYVKVYKFVTNQWVQVGSTFIGEEEGSEFGFSLSFSEDGSILSIGIRKSTNLNNTNDSGSVKIYKLFNDEYIQLGSTIYGTTSSGYFGYSTSLSNNGKIIAISARDHNNSENPYKKGLTQLYEFRKGDWYQIGTNLEGEGSEDEFGESVSLSADGTILAIGSEDHNSNSNSDSGKVTVYKLQKYKRLPTKLPLNPTTGVMCFISPNIWVYDGQYWGIIYNNNIG